VFAGHTVETPWTALQLAYFADEAMWTYLPSPSRSPCRDSRPPNSAVAGGGRALWSPPGTGSFPGRRRPGAHRSAACLNRPQWGRVRV